MHSQIILLIAGLASTTVANPLLTRQTDTCSQQRLTCGAAPGANQSLCASQKSACDACEAAYEKYITSPNSNKSLAASLRNECFAASTVGDGTGVNAIISSLTVAGTTPTLTSSVVVSTTASSSAPAGTTTAATTCDQQRLDCGAAPGANQSLCAVQKNSCDACEAAYEKYVTSPGSNKSFAASLRNECFAASKVGTGEGVPPIISSFSAVQAGAASATPTAAPGYPTATASTTAQSTTTSIYVNPGNLSSTSARHSTTVKPFTTLSTGTAPGNPASTAPPTVTVGANGAGSLKPVRAIGLLILGAAVVL